MTFDKACRAILKHNSDEAIIYFRQNGKIDINQTYQGIDGRNPLSLACEMQDWKLVATLIDVFKDKLSFFLPCNVTISKNGGAYATGNRDSYFNMITKLNDIMDKIIYINN